MTREQKSRRRESYQNISNSIDYLKTFPWKTWSFTAYFLGAIVMFLTLPYIPKCFRPKAFMHVSTLFLPDQKESPERRKSRNLATIVLSTTFILLILMVLASPVEASCRVGKTSCRNQSDCWDGDKNSTIPSNCQCCNNLPFMPQGECQRWEQLK